MSDFYEEDEPIENILAGWEAGEKGITSDCKECAAPYYNPFEGQPLRFLWWVDDSLHRRHTVNWFQRKLCNVVDSVLVRGL